jgi:aminoglycoside phosphotransferase (APT) family kinase protein
MVLYVPLSGRSLDQLAGAEEITACLEASAEWLAVLHGGRVHLDRVLDVPHEAANAAEWAAVVARVHPALADQTSTLADALLAEPCPAFGRAVPIHKDFHYQHVIAGDGIGVVDLDEARMGDAAFDVAHFAVNLRLLALRTAPSDGDADRWQRPFLMTYSAVTGWTSDDAFRWYTAYTCLKLARQLATGSGPRPRPSGRAREDQVGRILTDGLGCLGA